MAFNLNSCAQECFGCIKAYKGKHELKAGDQFKIGCKGIPKDFVPASILSAMPEDEQEIALSMLDPVTWAKNTIDWHCLDPDGEVWKRKNPDEYYNWIDANPGKDIEGHSRYHRPYQAEMLRCTAQNKVFRIGRQAGKCLPSGTLIQMADGTQKSIEEVQDGDLVASVTDDYRSVTNPAFRACNGEKDVLKIELMDGREIEATYNHPFLSRQNVGRETTGTRKAIFYDEWKPSEELTENDYLAVPRNLVLQSTNGTMEGYADEDEYSPKYSTMTMVGCMLADGNITGRNCRFSNQNPEIFEAFRDSLRSFNCCLKHYESDAECDYHVLGNGSGKKHEIKNLFRSWGLQGLDSHQKFIPDDLLRLCDRDIINLLRALFGCDGWASVDKNDSVEIGYSTVSEQLANQVVALLARFGVYTTINHKVTKLNGKKFHSRQLVITRKESIANFRNKIGILGKDEAIEKVYEISQLKNSSPKTEAYEDNDIAFIKIRSIRHVGKKMTWDLTVPGTHNFIANNIVTHNTETLVISMLFHMFTKPRTAPDSGFKIVIITPYQSQIDLIFTRMTELIHSSATLSNSIKRSVKAPIYQIRLLNESVVSGFTAGTKSGGNAESVRGQTANMLVFDEADYLSDGDLDAAMAITTNFPDATVWMSSTPSGKRERFYRTCLYDRSYQEYHFPSSVNPLFNERMNEQFKESLTEIGYKHEILAAFGEQEMGVFQNSYTKAAKRPYQYGDYAYNPTWTYAIGVDWNDTANGTNLVVVGFNPRMKKFVMVDHEKVSKDGWTQLAACEKLVELNRLWRPFSIYVDSGHGGGQWEVLKKFGWDSLRNPEKGPKHQDSKMRFVKQYKFGSSLEIPDPFTGEPVKKPAKPFLVNQLVRRFEAQDIEISAEDTLLGDQLAGYVVLRMTPTGVPVYGTNDEKAGDHILDGLMLAMISFTLESELFGSPKFSTDVRFTGQFGSGVQGLDQDGRGPSGLFSEGPSPVTTQETCRPQGDRSSVFGKKSILSQESELPAANTLASNHEVQPWARDDFMHSDKPAPKSRSAFNPRGRRSRLAPRSTRPVRKNI